MIDDIIFYIGLSLFLMHEMDAVRKNEWKMFFYLSTLEQEKGFAVFSLLHIPFFFFIFWGLFAADEVIRNHLMLVLDVFFILHFFLHLAFIRHHNNEFKSAMSWFIIGGLFLFGMVNIWV